jgi:NADH-quinone oxidoreductase subunit C
MTAEAIGQLLVAQFGPEWIAGADWAAPCPCLGLAPAHLVPVCEWLHDEYFDHCACLTGLDNGPAAGTLEVVYQLYSIPENLHLALRVVLPRNAEGQPPPQLPSVAHIWRTAEWHEREVYDLFGIEFAHHPDLRRILLPADWQGHPLRKDYAEQEKYHGLKVAY